MKKVAKMKKHLSAKVIISTILSVVVLLTVFPPAVAAAQPVKGVPAENRTVAIVEKEAVYHYGAVYDVNGGDPSGLTPEHFARPHRTIPRLPGVELFAPQYVTLGGTTRPGYIFAGWQLSGENGFEYGEPKQPGDFFVGWGWWTLRAVWEPDPTIIGKQNVYHYGVVYDVNGGDPASLTPEHYAYPHQIKTTPPGVELFPPHFITLGGATRKGYDFAGWQLYTENGFAQGEPKQPGDYFVGWGWWTLRAVWTPAPKIIYPPIIIGPPVIIRPPVVFDPPVFRLPK